MIKTLRGKCPNCCPDGGACFTLHHPGGKKCNNCGHILPYRRIKPTGQPTASQQQAIEHLVRVFGGSVTKQNMIGRRVWVSIHNPARHWANGDTVYGTIGPRGQLDLKFHRIGSNARIRNDIDVRVYLKSY